MGQRFKATLSLAMALVASVFEHIDSQWSQSNEFDNCRIRESDANEYPWSVGLRISFENENDAYWPAVIIGPHTLIADGRTFRAPNRKLRILSPNNYSISLTNTPVADGYSDLEISYIRPHPKIGVSIQYWMTAEHDFALIHTRNPINFTRVIRPLCLPNWDQEYWESCHERKESYIKDSNSLLITGWTCKYYYALPGGVNGSAGFDFLVYPYEDCFGVWQTQPEYMMYEGVNYINRICGGPTVRKGDLTTSEEDLDPGFCGEKGYYATGKLGTGDEWSLLGKFNGFGQQVFAGPTGYVSMLTPSIVEWIRNTTACDPGQYACNNGACIPLVQRCDQVQHCADGSDEDPVYCRALDHCGTNQFECGVYGPCMPAVDDDGKERANCDGVRDCPNGEDEDPSICLQPDPSWFSRNWGYIIGSSVVGIIAILLVSVFVARRTIIRRRLYLSEDEIKEFMQGVDSELDGNPPQNVDRGEIQLSSMQMPYIYDIKKERFKWGPQIGSGAFGDVYEGRVDGRQVAIKVLKKGTVEKEIFKTFLIELKTLAFVNFIKGGHKNVVNLVGAYVEEIRNLELHIALEFCEHGSIIDYFKKHSHTFEMEDDVDNHSDSQDSGLNVQLPGQRYIKFKDIDRRRSSGGTGRSRGTSTSTSGGSISYFTWISLLHRWLCEIADGMHFLASHNIVHGDLAARNVLLDSNLNAKISDFGLSRQMYYYNKSGAKVDKDTKLPWPWMAPEVLGAMRMSPASDVWSFGIVAWELYTLGGVPYGGLDWSPKFVDQLKCGLRLPKPEHATEELFHIIEECWAFQANARPDFNMLHHRLLVLSNPYSSDL